jgi:hypothetical protein
LDDTPTAPLQLRSVQLHMGGAWLGVGGAVWAWRVGWFFLRLIFEQKVGGLRELSRATW